MLVFDSLDDDDGRLEQLHQRALALGLDCAVEVRDEEELEQALDRVDPEIFLLSAAEADDDRSPLEVVLDLLAAVPAGKLAIADLPLTTPRRGQRARARRLRRGDRPRQGSLAARRRPAARGLTAARNGGTLSGMRATLVGVVAALALVVLVPASPAAPKAAVRRRGRTAGSSSRTGSRRPSTARPGCRTRSTRRSAASSSTSTR